jgi:predicted CoA-binding protein
MGNQERTVVVLGASNDPKRYSNMAVRLLKEHGYRVIPVHPQHKKIEDLMVARELESIHEPVDTLTLYVGPVRSAALSDSIVALKPGRIIFNPGSECADLEKRLSENQIPFLKACTLVMLQSGRF